MVIGAVYLVGALGSSDKSGGDAGLVVELVHRGPFRVRVIERGQSDSMKNATLTSKVRRTTTIIWIIPEGTLVKKGDVVCRLDSAEIFDKLKQQEIDIAQSSANVKKATENVEIQKKQNESDLAKAQLELDLAQLDLEKFKSGEALQQKNKLRGELLIAQEELNQADEYYRFFRRVARKGYKSQNELEGARIAALKAKNKLDVAKEALKVYEQYTYKRTLRELTELASDSIRELERVRRKGLAALAGYEATLFAATQTHQLELSKLKRRQEELAACTMVAPQDGKVVYVSKQSRRSEPAVIEEGSPVRENQEVIKLPDFTQMKVDARIHESKISRIRVGLPVVIRIDAFPDVVYHGVVDSVADVPVPGSWPNFDIKEYPAVIRITDDLDKVAELKPGLTAEVEIQVVSRENVLQVPVQSIVTIGEKHYAFVLTDRGPELRKEIKIGDSNDKSVEILAGLEEGEQVILNPRSRFGSELAALKTGSTSAGDQDAAVAQARAKKSNKTKRKPQAVDRTAKAPGKRKKGRKGKRSPGTRSGGQKNAAAMFKRFDTNGDGKLTADEAPEFLKSRLSQIDGNKDGAVSLAEWKKAAAAFGRRGKPSP